MSVAVPVSKNRVPEVTVLGDVMTCVVVGHEWGDNDALVSTDVVDWEILGTASGRSVDGSSDDYVIDYVSSAPV